MAADGCCLGGEDEGEDVGGVEQFELKKGWLSGKDGIMFDRESVVEVN